MTITNKRSLIALLLSLVLVVSLFTVSVFADTSSVSDETEVTESVESSGSNDEEKEEDKKEEDKTDSSSSSSNPNQEEIESTKNSLIINTVIIVCIIAIAVALIIRFNKKVVEFMRSVKSELKKIVWSSKENTRKSFIVVIVVAVAVAVAIFLMDTAFEYGVGLLSELL